MTFGTHLRSRPYPHEQLSSPPCLVPFLAPSIPRITPRSGPPFSMLGVGARPQPEPRELVAVQTFELRLVDPIPDGISISVRRTVLEYIIP
ncbi:hypothetical protein CCUS01_12988 [Colletotrichum cuscutae]|uniref:Uncharacterized protein n=1 Tax=Colletotrichum cuscutae TaxID=1209917 RepID=A0AAI9YCM5_9PEZI|nr:hypothetical protein CCUS01_12988 [Colletotrichum cuscutae]